MIENFNVMGLSYYGATGLFNGLVALVVGVYVLWRGAGNPVYRSFASFSISVALWSIAYAFWQREQSENQALFFIRLTITFCFFIPFSFLWFAQTFTAEENGSALPGYLYFILPCILATFGFHPMTIPGMRDIAGIRNWPLPGPVINVFVVLCNGLVLYSFWLFAKGWRRAAQAKREQILWVGILTLGAWVGGSTNWFLWYGIAIPPLPNFFVGVCFILITYAVLNANLFDLDTLTELIKDAKLSALTTFAAGMSHELRNPLYIIKSRAEICLDSSRGAVAAAQRGDSSEETMKIVLKEATRAMDIVQRFSDFVRPKKESSQPQIVVLKKVVEDVLWFLANEIKMKGIALAVNIPEDLAVFSDQRDLEEIVFNLAKNSIEAMEEHGGGLAIQGGHDDKCVTLAFRDTGLGIDDVLRRKIFRPFFTSGKANGTGLGLYIVNKLAEKNKILISLSPFKRGAGTTFTLVFKSRRCHSMA